MSTCILDILVQLQLDPYWFHGFVLGETNVQMWDLLCYPPGIRQVLFCSMVMKETSSLAHVYILIRGQHVGN
jgi:hypothetical protein